MSKPHLNKMNLAAMVLKEVPQIRSHEGLVVPSEKLVNAFARA